MIIDYLLILFSKTVILITLILISYAGNYFKTIFKRVFFNYFISIVISYVLLSSFTDTQIDFIIICEISFLLFVCLAHIYIPLLIDRSFSISIFFVLYMNSHSRKSLSIFFQKNFDLFIEKRVDYLIEKKFIIETDDKIELSNKGRFIYSFYNFFRKIFNITNNNIE